MADAQEESPSYPLPVGEIDLDDVTINNATMHKLSAEKGAFVNLGFSEEDDKASLKTLQAEASVTKSSLEASLQEWLRYLRYVQSNKRNIKEQIEERRDVLVKMINEHAEDLIRQSEDLVGSYEQQALSMKTTLTGTISEVSEFINNEIEGLQHNNNFKEDEEGLLKHCGFLVKQLQTIRKKTSVATPLWLPLKLYNKTESEYLTTHLFGNVRLVEQKDYPLKYCEPLSLLKRISTYYKHDQMPTGVVDMTVTATGNILVCDKLNKSLKMFTREGALDKVIKTGSLKDPNRITRWSHNNGFLVNDNYIRFIKMYDSEGDYVKDFLNDVKCPTSLCVNHLGDLLVTEYETKTILVFGPGGESKFSFKTLMGAPAHVSAGPRGHIVVTDWRHHTMKVFHMTGECAWSIKDHGSGNTQLDQPQGTCFDPFGNILVADANNHRIQCFTDEGHFVKTIISRSAGLRLPMAVHCDVNGYLYIAEYQGFVKVFKYLQHEDEQTSLEQSTNNNDSEMSTKKGQPKEDETSL